MPPRSQWGKTPWGAAFLSALGAIDSDGRLKRGATIANTGKVLQFSLKGSVVEARVQGSYAPFYHVKLTFNALSEEACQAALAAVKANPVLLGA